MQYLQCCGFRPVNDYLRCGYRTLEKTCTPEHAKWFEDLTFISMEPYRDLMDCEMGEC